MCKTTKNDIIALGIHVGHDRCAALVVNGVLKASMAQERLDRIKHSDSSEIPYEAIDKLLEYLNISFSQINYIGLSFSSVNIHELEKYYEEELRTHYNSESFIIVPTSHHLAHAASVFYTSPFEKALILIADGGGDYRGKLTESESLFLGVGNDIHELERRYQIPPINTIYKKQNFVYPFMNKELLSDPISLGRKYEQITYLLGFKWGQCGKTMGLASYGKSLMIFSDKVINKFDFELNLGDILQELYVMYLASGKKYYEFINDEKANISQTIQKYTEHIIINLIKYITAKYNIYNICLAGGTFLNCMLNHKLLEEIPELKIHICPAAGDDGQATGAAFHAYHKSGQVIKKIESVLPYLGFDYDNDFILTEIKHKNLKYEFLDDSKMAKTVAEEVMKNKIIALFRGRSEFGPRALCHRSIIANPTWDGMKDYLNMRVKHREEFRPFAPVVTEERAKEIFDLKQVSPYMLLACNVKEEYRDKIPSVTHVDYSARVQTVTSSKEPFVYDLLKEIELLSGVPVILNTSFNDNGEPIVESPSDAIKTFLNTQIDILVMENYIIRK